MMDWTAALEQLAIVRAVKNSFYAYPIINALHIAAVGALLTSVILMDLRLLGRFANLPEGAFVRLLRRVALVAFAIALLTGVLMFSVRAGEYAASALYWSKMGLIAAAGLNFAAFSMLDRGRADGVPLSPGARFSAALSMLLWSSVLLAGRFLGFV